VDSKNTIFKLAQIRLSATKALKFDRTPGSKQHNINFHVFFDYTAGKTYFLSPRTALSCTNLASTESLWTVDSWNTIFKLAQITLSATKALKFDRTSGLKKHNINFHVFFDYTAGRTCFYLHARLCGAQMKHLQKAYGPWIPELQFSSWPRFLSLLRRP
jgi:hypothetical protein